MGKELQRRFAIIENSRHQGYIKRKLSDIMTFAEDKEDFLKRNLG